MAEEEASLDNGEAFRKVRMTIAERSKRVAETKEKTKKILSKQAVKIAKQAEEHERFITKVTHLLSVLGFGAFCFILGARPQDVPYVYCLFYVTFVPLRWIYYRYKKWHYYLLDFCYYANTIFLITLLFFPKHEKLFMVCFSFAEGPLAWALIIWRCSLVFSSADKIVSVLIHLLPGIVFFTIRWWNPETLAAMHPVGKAKSSWPYVEEKSYLWTWLFAVPLVAYTLWQLLYFLIVNVLRRQRLLRDPEVMTSYRELSKKAQKANNIWWRLSGLLGDQNRQMMYILLQALFTVATMALTVPIFLSYEMHVIFQVLKVSATVWNGGNFLLDVMPRQVVLKEKKKLEMQPIIPERPEQPSTAVDSSLNDHNASDEGYSS
ncbi:glycerophosphocholine acyltransferase 1-like [Dioscorea cayenensis subsp. rotundata]|uniref:Glycerophosphocholine acyltransferase 1 n=1 Tax=Dioscorea cayennensis subsp. rotundata TaxID=55577 RepID=A0AB40AS89_DIOCR|nr:glycerophosphocholine acyltransferase 1-like [Dioscorea cayenensis subsp. rotundata]